MIRPGPVDVRLVRFSLGTVLGLVGGTFEPPDDWHPEYRAESIIAITRMLLEAHDAMGVVADDASPWWVFAIVVAGQVVGDAGFHGPPAVNGPVEVEIGYQVVPAFRSRGVATRACALLLAHAWRHGADVVRADTAPGNVVSQAVLRANGFRPTAQGDLAVEAPVRPSA